MLIKKHKVYPQKLTRISKVDLKQEINPEMALENCSDVDVENQEWSWDEARIEHYRNIFKQHSICNNPLMSLFQNNSASLHNQNVLSVI